MQTQIGLDLDLAFKFINNQELVAIPTETVYGLAANALSIEAVSKIYQVKNYFDWNGLKYIELIEDDDRPITIDMFPSHPNAKMWFEDATTEIRNNKINSILND